MLSLGPSALIFRDDFFNTANIPEWSFGKLLLFGVSGVSRISRFWEEMKIGVWGPNMGFLNFPLKQKSAFEYGYQHSGSKTKKYIKNAKN